MNATPIPAGARSFFIPCFLALPVGVFLAAALAQAESSGPADDDSSRENARRLGIMRTLAEQISISERVESEFIDAERIPDPVYRFNDAARGFLDGTVWAWGRAGRPAALSVMADNENQIWIVETVSLSKERIQVVDASGLKWISRDQGVTLQPIPGASAPAKSAARRKRELRQLARQFTAYEMWDNDGTTELQRYELRLLPTPVHEYADAKTGIEAGGLFLFNYGGNPETVMVLEASRNENADQLEWQCGFGRISWAAVHVRFKDQEIWQQPKISGPTSTYILRGMPTPPQYLGQSSRTPIGD